MANMREIIGGPLGVTERLVMYYDPTWVEEVSVEVLATGLAHEILHVQLQHVQRGKKYSDRKRWNIAGDLFINSAMRDIKRKRKSSTATVNLWTFPDWAHMPEDYGFKPGLTADEYYRLLEEFDKAGKQPKPRSGGDEKANKGDPGDSGCVMKGCCGGVSGNPLSAELEGKVNGEKGRSEAEVHVIAKATAKAIQVHMESSEGRGVLPGSWSEFIDISDKVFDVPWRQKLANITRYSIGKARVGGLDYSRRRVSKRSYLRGILLPALIGYDPEIMFVIDSSGSMGAVQLADALRVCKDVLQQSGIMSAKWMEADVENKRDPMTVRVQDLDHIEIRGRGGTDFRPACRAAENSVPKPHIVIYVTDGDGPAPLHPPPGIHFIWVIVPSPYRRLPALWGDHVVLEEEHGGPMNAPYTAAELGEDEEDED
jgi:predicted metal-dependent peptidase